MSTDLETLYQRTVLEHCRSPRNFRTMQPADRVARGFNPLCGDKITIYLQESPAEEAVPAFDRNSAAAAPDLRIADISFEAAGCAICIASASMMTELIGGAAAEHARRQAEKVLAAFRPGSANELDDLGDIVALGSVRAYPSRIRCVTLPWRTFAAALDGDSGAVSTE